VRDIFFWIPMPPPPSGYILQTKDWDTYLDKVALATVVILLITVLSIVGLYAYFARRRRILSPANLFQPYDCMLWLLLSLPAGFIAGIIAGLTDLPLTPLSDSVQARVCTGMELIPTAIQIGLATALPCFVVAALLILIPGITPPAFKYRPQEWLFPWTRPKRS